MFLFYFINYQLARTLWNRDNFFAIPLQFCDRGLSFISNYTCLDEENYGRRNGCFFFPISAKGWKEKRKERERRKKRAVEHQLTTSRSSSRGSFLLGYRRKTCAHFNLSREYQTLTYSLDFFIIKIGSKRLVVIYPLWGEGEEVGWYRWLQWS